MIHIFFRLERKKFHLFFEKTLNITDIEPVKALNADHTLVSDHILHLNN